MDLLRLHRYAWWALLFLLAFSVLWKGGKTLDATWVLVAVAWCVVIIQWRPASLASGAAASREIPRLLWLGAIGFVLLTILSFLLSLTQNYGLDEVLRDGSLVLLFLAVAREARGRIHIGEQILILIAFSAFAAAAIGLPVYVLQPVSRFTGTFFDYRFTTDYWPNAWAEFVLLAWPVALWWTLRGRATRDRMVRLALLGFLFGTLLLSYSRGAILACIAEGLAGLYLLYAVRRQKGAVTSRSDLRWLLVQCAVVGCVALATFGVSNQVRSHFFPVESVTQKATFTAAEGNSSVSERRDFWTQAWAISWQRPLIGTGPYSFRFLQSRLQTVVYSTSDHAHNVILKFAQERGWIAALLFTLLVSAILLRSLVFIVRSQSHHLLSAGVLFVGVLGVFLHSMIDFNLQFTGIALPFWLMLGLLESLHAPQTLARSERTIRRGVEIALVTVLLVVAIVEGRFLLLSSLGRRAEARDQSSLSLQWYELAKGQVFSRDLHLSRVSLLLGLNRTDDASKALDDYFVQNGEDARAWKIQGDIAVLKDDLPAARSAYDHAFALGRYNYLSILEGLLTVLRDQQDDESIALRKDEVLTILARYADAIGANRHFIAMSDNVETFLRITPLVGELYPDREAGLQILAAKVDRHAKEERAKFSARKPGKLW